MINCRAIYIDGPLNSVTTEIAKCLSEQIKNSVFLDGAHVVAKEDLSHQKWTVATLMTATLRACDLAHEGKLAVISFPLQSTDWKIIQKICDHAGVTPICIRLEPGSESAALSKDPASFRSLTLDTIADSPQLICQKILSFLEASPSH